ncbi:MAG: hypothetical protein O2856_10475 [Planctomycetota bacterium]|nr:hypothetical protein [Planctomycetota bacterium]
MHALFQLADTIMFWGQTFENKDLFVILLLVLLEGLLSIDNALVLGLLASRVPKQLQGRALTYGLVGAFVFRFIAVATAQYLLEWHVVKLIGGGYLIYISVKHFFFESKEDVEEKIVIDSAGDVGLRRAETGDRLTGEQELTEIQERVPVPLTEDVIHAFKDRQQEDASSAATSAPSIAEIAISAGRSFWTTVVVIELTDIAFAVDSILAAIGLVGPPPEGHSAAAFHPKLWVVVTGGLLGIVLMRVAAAMFIRLLERFPRFELSAYLLIIVIGLKLLVDWGFNSHDHPHAIDFHNYSKPEFWIFWMAMLAAFGTGFFPAGNTKAETT